MKMKFIMKQEAFSIEILFIPHIRESSMLGIKFTCKHAARTSTINSKLPGELTYSTHRKTKKLV